MNVKAIAKESKIYKADSLFKNKKYTEAFSTYKSIFDDEKQISEQMLLKMAFIQEGLENYGECLYYLNVYQSKYPNPIIQLKINTLSEQYNLEGYENSAEQFLFSFIKKYFAYIQYTLLSISMAFCLFFLLYLFIKNKKSYVAFSFCLFFGLIGFSLILVSDTKYGISINVNLPFKYFLQRFGLYFWHMKGVSECVTT